ISNTATAKPDATGRQPCKNHQIPISSFNSISGKLLQYFTKPNGSGFINNLNLNVPFSYDGNSPDVRIDHNFSDRTKIFAKFNYAKYNVTQQAALGDIIGEGTEAHDYTTTGSLNLTHGFSAPMLTEARIGYNRYYTNVNGINISRPFNQELGIRNPNPDDISTHGLARIQINGMQGIGAPVVYP